MKKATLAITVLAFLFTACRAFDCGCPMAEVRTEERLPALQDQEAAAANSGESHLR